MLHRADPCGCEMDIGMSKAREPHYCDHGNLLVYVKSLGSKASTSTKTRSRRPMRRSEPKRDWTDARAKVDAAGCCRICKREDRPLEAAHVLGREHDEPKVSRATGEILAELYVHPDRIVEACGPFPEGCHGEIHQKTVDLLPYLTLEEQVQAVRDAGGIQHARVLLAPVDHRAELEANSVDAQLLRARVIELESHLSEAAA